MLGVLELSGRGAGFLRRREAGYLPANGDVHVGERVLRQYGLRAGDEIDGQTRAGGKGRGPSLEKVTAINGRPPQELKLHSAPAHPIVLRDEVDRPQPRLDRDAGAGMTVTIGRIAPDAVLDYRFLALSHNTVRGAAGAALLNAELLLARGYLKPR